MAAGLLRRGPGLRGVLRQRRPPAVGCGRGARHGGHALCGLRLSGAERAGDSGARSLRARLPAPGLADGARMKARNHAGDETRPGHQIVRRVVSMLVLDDFLDMDTMAMMTMTNSTAPTIMATMGSIPRNLVRSVSTITFSDRLTSVRESDCFISDGAAGWDD